MSVINVCEVSKVENSEGLNIIAEFNGEIKRLPSEQLITREEFDSIIGGAIEELSKI